MTDLGLTNKELNDGSYYGCAPCCESDPAKKKDWENTVAYPTAEFRGKQAELMGVDDLELGEELEITFRIRVKRLERNDRIVNGKTQKDRCVGFEFLSASDAVEVGGDDEEEGEDDAVESGAEMPEGSALGAVLQNK